MYTSKGIVRKAIRRPVYRIVRRLLNLVDVPIRFSKNEMAIRMNAVRSMRDSHPNLEVKTKETNCLHKYEAKVYSQHGEDGILAHIFSAIGVTDGRFIEFGVEDGTECNTANLSINFGWSGLLIEANDALAAMARRFYTLKLRGAGSRVRVVNDFVTAENVNTIFESNGLNGDIDLLSIDIDGVDYWVWKAIQAVSPRVVCIEYNSSFGAERSITVKYDPRFDRFQKHPSGLYYGASLAALSKLATEKGYILIGCDSQGVNAFFLRKDVAGNIFDGLSASEAYIPQYTRVLEMSTGEQFQLIQHMEFETV